MAIRKNILTARFQPVVQREHQQQEQVRYERGVPADPLQAKRNARNRDLDTQLVWRGRDLADGSDLYYTERHLLYVACTSARHRLMVTSVHPASEFVDDLVI